jgi:hypothetical protein
MSRPPFTCFKTSPEVIRVAVILYVHFPLSLLNVEDLLHERGIDITHETVRVLWGRCENEVARSMKARLILGFLCNLQGIFLREPCREPRVDVKHGGLGIRPRHVELSFSSPPRHSI